MFASVAALVVAASGLFGTVMIDPARPVCTATEPCSAPDAHDRLTFWHDNRRIGSVRTDARGHYRIALAPARYRVTTSHRGTLRFGGVEPARASVRRGRFIRADFKLDVGIR